MLKNIVASIFVAATMNVAATDEYTNLRENWQGWKYNEELVSESSQDLRVYGNQRFFYQDELVTINGSYYSETLYTSSGRVYSNTTTQKRNMCMIVYEIKFYTKLIETPQLTMTMYNPFVNTSQNDYSEIYIEAYWTRNKDGKQYIDNLFMASPGKVNEARERVVNSSQYTNYFNETWDINTVADISLTPNSQWHPVIGEYLYTLNNITKTTYLVYFFEARSIGNTPNDFVYLNDNQLTIPQEGLFRFMGYTSSITNYDFILTNINFAAVNTKYEVIDIKDLVFTILTMPFAFVSQAFNLTLFEGTPYQINISNLLLAFIGILVFIFLIKLITSKM